MDRVPAKVLCIVFKFLGDVVVALPAVRALKTHWPDTEVHVLVAEEAAPLLQTLPWIDRVWPFPRTRGRARLVDSWPMMRTLRDEHFDLSLDFVGNDRGALLSLAIGAKKRIGLDAPRGFCGRRLCYHDAVQEAPADWHETRRHLHFLRAVGVPLGETPVVRLQPAPHLATIAASILPENAVIGHITTSKPLKDWPVVHWITLARRARSAGMSFVFAAGPGAREQALLKELKEQAPEIPHLPQITGLDLYLALLARARALVSGDTGPMHFAAGLGIPTLSLFGPSKASLWAPAAPCARHLTAPGCTCSSESAHCTRSAPCLFDLTPERVWTELEAMVLSLPASASPSSASVPPHVQTCGRI